MPLSPAVRAEIGAVVGARHVITEPEELRVYDCDGLTGWRATPELVVLAGSTAEVQGVVRICARERVPFVARGAGTGLSGGALPVAEGIVISLARMTRILEIDLDSQRVVVEPGVANLDVTRAVAPDGFFYAPDPSSQQVCTIGGNVAENSGGAHCLKNGFTVNHVTGLTVVLPDGEIVELGGKALDPDGPDLLGAFIGSEGTLGIATEVILRVLRKPEAVTTHLAAFASIDAAGEAVSAIVSAGILPAAIEMMDRLTIVAVEQAYHPGYPDGRRGAPARRARRHRPAGRGGCCLGRPDLPRLRCVRSEGRTRRRRACASLARPQGGVSGDGPDVTGLLRAGRRRAADEAARGAAADRRALAGARPARGERVPCG